MNSRNEVYKKDSLDNVWKRPQETSFGYNDGDEIEERISSIIINAADRSVLSSELQKNITDWASNYHLSPQRANLIRPLQSLISGSILEIGSGCGAITRYLGEQARAVTALEGSRRRAQITRNRTQDLTNVEVYCDEFSAFETSERFDAVTLIGVLEYAHLFVKGDAPGKRMLSKAHSHLNEDGCLIIAIENQLGLKYFAGAPEDHLGRAMVGIEDQYQQGGVRTYGRQALLELLSQSGFGEVDFFYPLPDYKLPESILSEAAFSTGAFDPQPFLVATAGKDPQLQPDPGFSLERVWPVLLKNGLATDLSNSFLIVAKKKAGNPNATAATTLAWHYSTQRKPAYCKETLFVCDGGNKQVSIQRNFLKPNISEEPTLALGFDHHLDNSAPYYKGTLLSLELIDCVTRHGWTIQEIADFSRRYVRYLESISGESLFREGVIDWTADIPGRFLDAIPQNIYIQENEQAVAFDLEWTSKDPLKMDRLILRSLWSSLTNLTTLGTSADCTDSSLVSIYENVLATLGNKKSRAEIKEVFDVEIALQYAISGRPGDPDQTWCWLTDRKLSQGRIDTTLQAFKQQCDALTAQRAEMLAIHGSAVESLKKELNEARASESNGHDLAAHFNQRSDGLERETLALSAVIYKANQQASHREMGLRSVRGCGLFARSYDIAMRESSSGRNGNLSTRLVQTVKAVYAFWRPRSTIELHLSAESDDQAKNLLKQVCNWKIPFRSHLNVLDPQPEQSSWHALRSSGMALEITHDQTTEEQLMRLGNTASSSRPSSIFAFPIRFAADRTLSIAAYKLPSADRVRLAYIALESDPSKTIAFVKNKSPEDKRIGSNESSMITLIRGTAIENSNVRVLIERLLTSTGMSPEDIETAKKTLKSNGIPFISI